MIAPIAALSNRYDSNVNAQLLSSGEDEAQWVNIQKDITILEHSLDAIDRMLSLSRRDRLKEYYAESLKKSAFAPIDVKSWKDSEIKKKKNSGLIYGAKALAGNAVVVAALGASNVIAGPLGIGLFIASAAMSMAIPFIYGKYQELWGIPGDIDKEVTASLEYYGKGYEKALKEKQRAREDRIRELSTDERNPGIIEVGEESLEVNIDGIKLAIQQRS